MFTGSDATKLARAKAEAEHYKALYLEARARIERLTLELQTIQSRPSSLSAGVQDTVDGPFARPQRRPEAETDEEDLLTDTQEEWDSHAGGVGFGDPERQTSATAALLQASRNSARTIQGDRLKDELEAKRRSQRSPWQQLDIAAQDNAAVRGAGSPPKAESTQQKRAEALRDSKVASMLDQRELTAKGDRLEEEFAFWEDNRAHDLEEHQTLSPLGANDVISSSESDGLMEKGVFGAQDFFVDGSASEPHMTVAELDEFIH